MTLFRLFFLSLVCWFGTALSGSESASEIIARVGRIYDDKYNLKVVGTREGATLGGLWTVLGVILQGPGAFCLEEVRFILLDCRSILVDEINRCPDAANCFETFPFDNVKVMICFEDGSRSPALYPCVATACVEDQSLSYMYHDRPGEVGFSREVVETIHDAELAVSEALFQMPAR